MILFYEDFINLYLMLYNNKLFIKFSYNFNLFRSVTKKKKTLNIKILIFFLLILFKAYNITYKLKFKKKKYNKFTILKAPYKNKMAQRSYFISRFFFFLEIYFKENNTYYIRRNLESLSQLILLFFYYKL
uniref:Ymf59-like protein n=1 Tax=Paramecium gigas TaxID=2709424 RepID=UPI001D021600|nr:Ymf59-like protein [Paramecium gigas]QVG61513.1 Ymf59-like protein [Paramecium gigas]